MQMALEVMGAMESQAWGRACSGGGSQAPQTVTGGPQREGLTHTGDRKRDDVMCWCLGKSGPARRYIPIRFQHSEAKCAKQKKKCTRVSEHSYE